MGGARLRFPPLLASPPGGGEEHEHYFRTPWIACHTRCGVAGICRLRTPSGQSASMIAFMTVGVEPTVPDSPTPLTPSGLPKVELDASGDLVLKPA